MSLPKLYAPVYIKFSSLRNGLGDNLGVIFDIDTVVIRRCRRVLASHSWKWQICDMQKLLDWDWYAETDQEILDNDLDEAEFTISNKKEYWKQYIN